MPLLLTIVSSLLLMQGHAAANVWEKPGNSAAVRPPNVVFIMADDLGYSDLGATGSGYYETPHIDRLAAHSMQLTRYYHCQNCQPTRAAIFSGQYGTRTGVFTVGSVNRFAWWKRSLRPPENVTQLPLDRTTIAQVLQQAGYVTGMFGKWHLGEEGQYHPRHRGFDEAITSSGKHFNFTTNPQTDVPPGAYLADFLTDRAVDFIHRHRSKPFFLYLPHFGVHSPHEAKPELIAKFAARPPVGGHKNATYAAMIASVDESVGRVLDVLDELDLAENTVVIFTSDNGGVGGYAREGLGPNGDVTDNAPLRSGKGSLYEGGTRVPFFVRWPGQTQPGAKCDVPATHVDLFPTLVELTGSQLPQQTLDGESLLSLFRDPAANLKRDAIFAHHPSYLGQGEGKFRTTPASSIICGDWKLIEFFEDSRLELYNLREDVGEMHNSVNSHPDLAKQLHARLVAWRQSTGAQLPTPHTPGIKPRDLN
ncbi:MAG: sulfatase [Planctomycetaceae bacterium]|nr:sulfatase [Planctomycetaceae bacterium]